MRKKIDFVKSNSFPAVGRVLASVLAASLTVLCTTTAAQAQGAESGRRPDYSKLRIEAPLKRLMSEAPDSPQPAFRTKGFGPVRYDSTPKSSVASRAPVYTSPTPIRRAADMSKSGIERPLKRLMSDVPAALPEPAVLKEIEDKTSGDAKSNPNKVQPGLVTWHKDFNEAKEASAKSGKPVLMFHMMGQLDDRFC